MQVDVFQCKILVAFLFDSSSKSTIFSDVDQPKFFSSLPTMVALYDIAKLSKSDTQTKM